MVRLKNPLAELANAGPPLPRPAVDGRQDLLGAIDGELRRSLRAALADVRGRVLIVGGQWPELALELAEAGLFVTVLDPQEERLEQLRTDVVARGLTQKLTVVARSFGDAEFEAASFEAVVFYDPFPYLTAPRAMFKKCKREMRAGGILLLRTLLARGAVFPDPPESHGLTATELTVPELGAGEQRALAVRDRVLTFGYAALRRLGLLGESARSRQSAGDLGFAERRGPSWEDLRTALEAEFVVTEVRALQLLSYELAELACALRPVLGRVVERLVPAAVRADQRLLAQPGRTRAFAQTVLVRATKQRELGRVFLVPGR